ncbi:MAG: PD40 domain-containing protein [Lachnospiraceae bacterium]|nr:PD40 domain-containing protein [Lachnospiraceae bacterium]
MYYGIQLFGLRDRIRENTEELYRAFQEAGFSHVEPVVAFGELGGFEKVLWNAEECVREYEKMKAFGLEIKSFHAFAADVLAAIPQIRAMHEVIPFTQVVLGVPQDLSRKNLTETAFKYMAAAEALQDLGITVAVHNNAAEIETKINGMTAYEWLVKACLGKVKMQVDVGWVLNGKEDPEAFLWRNQAIISSVHYKDMTDAADAATQCVYGKGAIDALACLQFARANGLSQIFDQDVYTDAFAELKEMMRIASGLQNGRDPSISYLNTVDIETGEIKVLHVFEGAIEAPNWLKGENAMIYNANGHLYKYYIDTDTSEEIFTGRCVRINNDHVLSPDEKYIGISCGEGTGFSSYIYTLPIEGGEPKKITEKSPSFLHGWSPDGEKLAYCAFRPESGANVADIYEISKDGGEETPVTHDIGFCDGSEYAPDNGELWFHSTRDGLMQAFYLNDKGEAVRMTDTNNNWFPHVSPDGKKVAYITFMEGHLKPTEHLANMTVEIWVMDRDGSNKKKLTTLFGGQGTINVNSWAKDSRHLAFVSYELLHK